MHVRAFLTHWIAANEVNNFFTGQNSLHAPPDPCTGLPSVFNASPHPGTTAAATSQIKLKKALQMERELLHQRITNKILLLPW
jgi:hypothetical protein